MATILVIKIYFGFLQRWLLALETCLDNRHFGVSEILYEQLLRCSVEFPALNCDMQTTRNKYKLKYRSDLSAA